VNEGAIQVNYKLTRRLKSLTSHVVGTMGSGASSEGIPMAPVQDIEDAISDALQGRARNVLAAPNEVAPRATAKGQKSDGNAAQHLIDECDAVALAIQEIGQTVVNMANTISAETEALADLLRKHGAAMAVRIEEFMTMSDRIRDRMQAAHSDVVATSGETRSPAPQDRDT